MALTDWGSSSSKRVIRGKYAGEPGVIQIPPVDISKSHVNITSIPWTANAGSTHAYYLQIIRGEAGTVSVTLESETQLNIRNKIAIIGGDRATVSYQNLEIHWEIIEG
ncbi:hypothetical protein PPE03_13790 [Pseudoalteromonas peptidolytica]|nr:hypothetical protein PPE03_13790 [Pseudoalteromonas peptidolytica]